MPRPARLLPAAALALALALSLSAPSAAQTVEDARQAYFDQDFARAVEIARPLAAAGDPLAMNIMASMFEDAQGGLPYDPVQAFSLYTAAADLGLAAAQNNLGRVYHYGLLGQAVDALRAEALYLQAMAGGSDPARNNYALMQEEGLLGAPDWPTIIALYSEAASRDEPNAAANLANLYLNGRDGLPADPVLARQWAERSLAVENARGHRMLGYMMEFEIGGPQDTQGALDNYRRAHDLGEAAASSDLGLIHRFGAPGLPADPALAAAWFERGIWLGDVWSYVNLAEMLTDNDPAVTDDPARARQLYQAAHDMGNLQASVSLAYLHWDGIGGPVDFVAARNLLIHASDGGNMGATSDLGVMLEQGLGGPVDIPAAASHYRRAAEGGNMLAAQNLFWVLTNQGTVPWDPVEGLAWCHFSAERETDRQTQIDYRQNCTETAASLSEADRRAAITRSIALLAQF